MQTILIISAVLSWIVFGVLIISLLIVGRAHAELTNHVRELEQRVSMQSEEVVGHPAPDFRLSSLDKKSTISQRDLRGHPSLLIFLSPTCSPCQDVIQQLSTLAIGWQEEGGKLFGISSGDSDEMARVATRLGASFTILSQNQWEATRSYKAKGTPWGVAITADGMVAATGSLGSQEQLTALMEAARADTNSHKVPLNGIPQRIAAR